MQPLKVQQKLLVLQGRTNNEPEPPKVLGGNDPLPQKHSMNACTVPFVSKTSTCSNAAPLAESRRAARRCSNARRNASNCGPRRSSCFHLFGFGAPDPILGGALGGGAFAGAGKTNKGRSIAILEFATVARPPGPATVRVANERSFENPPPVLLGQFVGGCRLGVVLGVESEARPRLGPVPPQQEVSCRSSGHSARPDRAPPMREISARQRPASPAARPC